MKNNNKDDYTIRGFGDEWSAYTQDDDLRYDLIKIYDDYFKWISDKDINFDNVLDVGCGSGRWGKFIAQKAKKIMLLDPSIKALNVAKKNLDSFTNVKFKHSTVEGFAEKEKFSFVYSLGVLHHIPDTRKAISTVSNLVENNGYILLYLYYRFDNRPFWFRLLWKFSNIFRRIISVMPFFIRKFICLLIAYLIYWPISRSYSVVKTFGISAKNYPLSYYNDKKMDVLKTDALDRFGTNLENRFTKSEITEFLIENNFIDIQFKDGEPYWTVLARKHSK